MEVTLVLQVSSAAPFTVATPPWVVFAVDGVITEVLDLCDPQMWSPLSTTLQELTGDWAYSQQEYLRGRGPLPATQLLGQAAYDSGQITGLRYPSAKRPNAGNCLVVFADRLVGGGKSYLEVYDPSLVLQGRVP
jgi:hypothetical protein